MESVCSRGACNVPSLRRVATLAKQVVLVRAPVQTPIRVTVGVDDERRRGGAHKSLVCFFWAGVLFGTLCVCLFLQLRERGLKFKQTFSIYLVHLIILNRSVCLSVCLCQ